jgi:hypothetical protein
MPEPTQQQISAFGAKLSWITLTASIGFAQTVFKFKWTVHTRDEMLQFLANATGLPASTISLADQNYYTIEWSDWLKFINSEIVDKIKAYVTDTWDCENYAFWFSTFSDLCMSINTGGTAFGKILDPTTNNLLFGHGFNMIVATEGGVMKLVLFEPQTKQFKMWYKNQANILPVQATQDWKYVPNWIIFY